MKILVTYFSRTGYTRRVAERLARELHATVCPIEESGSRLGFLGYSRCLLEASFDIDPRIKPIAHDPAQFDLVVIGTPIWGWQVASPPRAFARIHSQQIKRAAFFCTMGGSGSEKAFAQLRQAVGSEPVATLALTDREIDANSIAPKLKAFVHALRAGRRAKAVSRAATAQRPQAQT
ncbi:MAG TPA: flavodoxin [Burkholderiaceae bacterium]|nr:flavodoxin [Burkholderiaceae bacterium]